MNKLKLLCNAKINLTLDICSKREDGYHNIDSVMQSISLPDIITVKKAEEIAVKCSSDDLIGEQNIASLAARQFFTHTKIEKGAEIYIEKHIPCAAGMGGGSADAAGVILALDRIYKTSLSKERLCEIALNVGADVPFCLFGGTKRVQGIGEIVKEAPQLKNGAFVIIKKQEKRSTAEMYKKLDSMDNKEHKTGEMISAIKNGRIMEIADNLSNSFERIWDISYEKRLLLENGAFGVCLSGSGPTVYGFFENIESAKKAENAISDGTFFTAVVTPEESSVKFIDII